MFQKRFLLSVHNIENYNRRLGIISFKELYDCLLKFSNEGHSSSNRSINEAHMRIGIYKLALKSSRDPLVQDLWEPFQPAERRTRAECQESKERERRSEGMQPVSPHCSGLRPWKD